ncbi:MAG: hypothetical protein ACK4UN_04130 [Limisphaerales bacterium]
MDTPPIDTPAPAPALAPEPAPAPVPAPAPAPAAPVVPVEVLPPEAPAPKTGINGRKVAIVVLVGLVIAAGVYAGYHYQRKKNAERR